MSSLNRSQRSLIPLVILGVLWLGLAAGITWSQLNAPGQIEVTWTTETEFQTAGFNVLRSSEPDGEFEQINVRLIPGKGNSTVGASYSFVDSAIKPGQTYFYRLEEVELDNSRQMHDIGPGEDTADGIGLRITALLSLGIGIFLLGTAAREKFIRWTQTGSFAQTQISSGKS